jgi:CRISPR system Cascade subunit CasD
MTSIVLHLRGPMQSWGGDSRLNVRLCERVPTKSGLVGLLAAAQGRPRGSDVSDLVELQIVIRVDQDGQMMRDYHTVGGGYPKGQRIKVASGKERPEAQAVLVSERYYLADAAFTVMLSGDTKTITASHEALLHPRWAPALGRRSCSPAEPFIIGMVNDDPVTYLQEVLPVVRRSIKTQGRSVTFIADDPDGQTLGIRDVPHKALNEWRFYGERKVRRWTTELEKDRFVSDPLVLLERVGSDGRG